MGILYKPWNKDPYYLLNNQYFTESPPVFLNVAHLFFNLNLQNGEAPWRILKVVSLGKKQWIPIGDNPRSPSKLVSSWRKK